MGRNNKARRAAKAKDRKAQRQREQHADRGAPAHGIGHAIPRHHH